MLKAVEFIWGVTSLIRHQMLKYLKMSKIYYEKWVSKNGIYQSKQCLGKMGDAKAIQLNYR